jgi:hypothetical protein
MTPLSRWPSSLHSWFSTMISLAAASATQFVQEVTVGSTRVAADQQGRAQCVYRDYLAPASSLLTWAGSSATQNIDTPCRLTAGETAASCELAIESTLVYLSGVNKFVRGCIERGADSGLAKNFAQYVELLGKDVAVTDLTKLLADAPPAEVSSALIHCPQGGSRNRVHLQLLVTGCVTTHTFGSTETRIGVIC